MEILFLSHCVPAPPNKGERIRCWHELRWLAARHRVHLACFARNREELEAAQTMKECCESVSVEPLVPWRSFARGAMGFAAGLSVSAGWYRSSRMLRQLKEIVRRPLDAAFVYTVAMGRYAPAGVPFVLDMADVDSEKWLDYARTRRLGLLYGAEARRFRALEIDAARKAARVLLTTLPEVKLFGTFAPEGNTFAVGNGVDFEYFRPGAGFPSGMASDRYFVFAGTMDYYPNVEGAGWFARQVFPKMRARDPRLRFVIAGRDPCRAVRRLAGVPGVIVTGTLDDVRPYLAGAQAVVVPLRTARGVQNKVLEALAMGKTVLASEPVCATFGADLPVGIVRCGGVPEWIRAMSSPPLLAPVAIRAAAQHRFSWAAQMSKLAGHLEAAAAMGLRSAAI